MPYVPRPNPYLLALVALAVLAVITLYLGASRLLSIPMVLTPAPMTDLISQVVGT
jgi:hypothetical protein